MAVASAEATQKAGIWTEHVDDSSGRKYYFNMVQNRSYWELPEELLAQVKRPVIDTLREWDPEAAEKYENTAGGTKEEEEAQRKRREELLAAASAADANAGGGASVAALHERMALAAQKKAEEAKRLAAQEQTLKEREEAANNEYLKMVRELQAKDRDTESSGGKWLVR